MMLWQSILGVAHINLVIQTGNHVVMIHQQDHKITLGVILTCVDEAQLALTLSDMLYFR